MSVLVNLSGAPSSTNDFFSFDGNHTANSQRGKLYVKTSGTGIVFGLGWNGAPTVWSSEVPLNQTHLIVIKAYPSATLNEVASFFVNPAIGSTESAVVGTNGLVEYQSTNAANGLKYIRGITLKQRASIVGTIGGIRFSDNWADVVKSGATKLATPEIGTASAATGLGFTANWTAVTNASGYEVKAYAGATLAGTYTASGQATISVIIDNLAANTTYTYKVQAIGNGTTYSNSDQSAASAEVTTLNVPKLTTPTIAAPSDITTSGFTANWDVIPNVVDYDVKVYLNASLVNTFTSTTNSKAITGLSLGTQYTYTVIANGDGTNYANSDPSSSASAITAGMQTPVATAATAITSSGFTANWGAILNATNYDVEVYHGATLKSTTNVVGQASSSLAITGLNMGTSYTYKVIAKDGSATTATSNSISFVTIATELTSINTNFNDGNWVTNASVTSGSYPVAYSDNGYSFNAATVLSATKTGLKGEDHVNYVSIDKSSYSGSLTLPTVSSLSQIEIHAGTGTAGRTFNLQEYVASAWTTLNTFTTNASTSNIDEVFLYNISRAIPTKLRITNAGTGTMYIYNVITRSTTPTQLGIPTIGSPTAINATGFTANWTAVPNATGYKVFVYDGTTLVNTFSASGQATVSLEITGLTENTSYTHQVLAVGDGGVSYIDSYLSDAKGYIVNSATISLLKLTSNSDLTVSPTGSLTIDAAKTISTLTLKSGKDDSSFSMKLDAKLTATNVRLFKTIDDTKWYFMSFPCDVAVNAITKSNSDAMGVLGTDWFIKYYDGNKRSIDGVSNGSNWVSVTNGTLTAKKGYIFGLKTGSPETELLIPLNTAILNAEAQSTVPVLSYSTGTADVVHKGWNLVGQPFLSHYAAQTGSDATYMIIPNSDGKTYTVKSKALSTLPVINPFSAYFVQSETDGNLTFGLTGRQGVRSLVEENSSNVCQLNISTPTGIDETYLILDDQQSTSYQIGQDMEKWIGTGTDKPQIYTLLNGINYAFNALPISSVNGLPIGIYTKASVSTTISAVNSLTSGISSLLLKDNLTGITTDLLVSNYSFTSSEGTDISRFLVTIKRVSTANIIETGSNNPNILIKNGSLQINNLTEKATVKVYDAIGHLLLNKKLESSSYELPLNVNGIYTVKVEMGPKTLTKKVIL